MLLEDREREAIQAGDVRAQPPLADAGVVLAERHVEGPMARVLHRPVAPHRPGEQLDVHRQAAEVVADLYYPPISPSPPPPRHTHPPPAPPPPPPRPRPQRRPLPPRTRPP